MFDDAPWTRNNGGNKRGDSGCVRRHQQLSREFRSFAKIGTTFFARFLHHGHGRNVIKRGGYIKIVGFEFFTASFTDFANSSNVIRVACGRVMISVGKKGKKRKRERGEFLLRLGIKIFSKGFDRVKDNG